MAPHCPQNKYLSHVPNWFFVLPPFPALAPATRLSHNSHAFTLPNFSACLFLSLEYSPHSWSPLTILEGRAQMPSCPQSPWGPTVGMTSPPFVLLPLLCWFAYNKGYLSITLSSLKNSHHFEGFRIMLSYKLIWKNKNILKIPSLCYTLWSHFFFSAFLLIFYIIGLTLGFKNLPLKCTPCLGICCPAINKEGVCLVIEHILLCVWTFFGHRQRGENGLSCTNSMNSPLCV